MVGDDGRSYIIIRIAPFSMWLDRMPKFDSNNTQNENVGRKS
jgi:hypothetical protein